MNSGVTTSSAAPVSEMLRTVQSIPAPPNDIVPAFSIRCLGAIRCSFIGSRCAWNLRNSYDALLSASLRETNTCSQDQGSRSGSPAALSRRDCGTVSSRKASRAEPSNGGRLRGSHRNAQADGRRPGSETRLASPAPQPVRSGYNRHCTRGR